MTSARQTSSRSSFFQRFWKPASITGAGGTAAFVWFEELLLFSAEILALILLPIMAGLIYLLNILAFKSTRPRKEQ
ncbi:MAG: hypothetical protein L6461_09265 [Anaerolineae bacterium]|nr:hypothetical protein [Anaerolineae bacterium]